MNHLESATAAQVKAWRQLGARAGREAHGHFLAEGEHLCLEALQEQRAIRLLVAQGKTSQYARLLQRGVPVTVLTDRQFQQISDTRTPQGIAALCALPPEGTLAQLGDRLVALNAVQDPGNVGTILRTMDAAGFTGLLLDGQCADVFAPKALRASMGAAFRVPVRRVESLPEALKRLTGHTRIAGALEGTPFFERPPITGGVCIIIGNEGAGISPKVLACADMTLKLPMPGKAESLNAAVAAGIMMYDFVRVSNEADGGREA